MILLKRRLFQKDVYLLVFILMVLSQAVFCCVFMHADGDDAQYVAMATTVLQTDRLSGVLPSTGGETIFGLQAQYYLAPFPYFWALWGKFLNLHPAILMHTFLPAVLIVFAYAVYSLVARQLFEGIQKRYFFLYVLCVCNVWGNYSIRTSASYLLLRPWQGKAMLTAAFIPLLMYLAVRLSKAGADLIDWSLLLLSCIATCLISGMSFILVPLFLGMVTVFEFIENKSVKAVIRYLSCMVPYFIVFIIYYVKRV